VFVSTPDCLVHSLPRLPPPHPIIRPSATTTTTTTRPTHSDAKKAATDAAAREASLTDATRTLKKQLEQKSLDLVDARTKLAAAESAANRAAADAKAQVYML
jgi:hypothetical protein